MRYRRIMVTTMAALFGGLPLAFGTGAGSELRRPLGIAIVGGLLLSQFPTLYTTPVIYIYLSKFVGFFRSGKKPNRPHRTAINLMLLTIAPHGRTASADFICRKALPLVSVEALVKSFCEAARSLPPRRRARL